MDTKTYGTNGTSYEDNFVPGTPGLDGGDGAIATDVSDDTTDTENSATAVGGSGGRGQDGGPENPTGERAGNGGFGGLATAAASVSAASAAGNSATATATGGNGGGGGVGGPGSVTDGSNGSNGYAGGAEASASAVNSGGAAAATAVVTGGNGGNSTVPLISTDFEPVGSDGASVSGSTASAIGTTSAKATVNQTGGSGGGGSSGGAGGSSVLTNAVSGQTDDGTLTLTQVATGGNGGRGQIAAFSAAGGDARSDLSLSDTSSATIDAIVTATAGGAGISYVAGEGFEDYGLGGNAEASANVTGIGAVYSQVEVTGGDGTIGGNATATDIATGVGAVNAYATAEGGDGFQTGGAATVVATATRTGTGTGYGKDVFATAIAGGGEGLAGDGVGAGTASALATAAGTDGAAYATAFFDAETSLTHGYFDGVDAYASAPVAGTAIAAANASDGGTIAAFNTVDQSVADVVLDPISAAGGVVAGPGGVLLLNTELGDGNLASVTGDIEVSSTITGEIDFTTFSPDSDLLLDLHGSDLIGDGVTGVVIDVQFSEGGFYESFSSGAAAQAFFANTVIDIGALSDINADRSLTNFEIFLHVTVDQAGSGFYADPLVAIGSAPVTVSSTDVFSDKIADAGEYLWSNAANWSAGEPGNGANVEAINFGFDDVANLTLNSLYVLESEQLVEDSLTVNALTVATGAVVADSDNLVVTGLLINDGIITTDPSTLAIDGAVNGDGTIEIGAGSDVIFNGAVSADQTVDFLDSTGTLTINDAADFKAKLEGSGTTILAGDDVFSDNVAAGSGAYLWSDAANWSAGVPVDGDTVIETTSGPDTDDIPGLTLSALQITAPGSGYDPLVVDAGLSVAKLTISSSSGSPAALEAYGTGAANTVSIGSLTSVPEDGYIPQIRAFGAGTVIDVEAASGPIQYDADGGRVDISGAIAPGSFLNYELSHGTFALANPGSVIAATLSSVYDGDVLELPGTAVKDVIYGADGLGGVISSLTIATDKGTFDFGHIINSEDLTDYSASYDAATGLEAITFGSHIFYDNHATTFSLFDTPFLWSTPVNWSGGSPPTNGNSVIETVPGTDDIPGLTLSALQITGTDLTVEAGLSVATLSIGGSSVDGYGGTVGSLLEARGNGAPDTLSIGSITAGIGDPYIASLLAEGGAVINVAAAASQPIYYEVETGSRIEITGALKAGSSLSYNGMVNNTLALASPGPVIAATLSEVQPGDVLELPGTTVEDVTFDNNGTYGSLGSLTITTDKGAFEFDHIFGSGALKNYTASHDTATGLEAITFTSGTGSVGISNPGSLGNGWTVTSNPSVSGATDGVSNGGTVTGGWNLTDNGTLTGDSGDGASNTGTVAGGWTVSSNSTISGGTDGVSNNGSVSGGWDVAKNVNLDGAKGDGLANSGTVTDGWDVSMNGSIDGGTDGVSNTGSVSGGWDITGNNQINGGTNGISNTGSVSGGITIENTGTITGGVNGILNTDSGGDIANSGIIAGKSGIGIRTTNGGGISNLSGGTIAGGMDGILSGDGSVTNQAGGVISGLTGIILTSGGSITNAGTIIGTGGTAIAIGADATVLLTIDPGAVFEGNVADAAGDGTLELGSAAVAGTLGGIGTSFIGFSDILIDVGASWALDGSNTIAAGQTLADDGALNVSGIFTNNGFVTTDPATLVYDSAVIGSGTIEINAGSDITFDGSVASTQTIINSGTLVIGDLADFDAKVIGDGIIIGATLGAAPVVVGSGETAIYQTIGSGGSEFLESGATVNITNLAAGGVQDVLAGGVANYTVVDGVLGVAGNSNRSRLEAGGVEVVEDGGTSNGTHAFPGGIQYVLSGGTAVDTSIAFHGTMLVAAGGTTSGVISFEGSDAVLSLAGTVLPDTEITGFEQNNRSNDAIILTGFTYAAGDGATLSAGVLTLDLSREVEKLDFNPAESNAGHSFEVTTNSLDQVVIIDPLTGTTPNMDFLAPAKAAGSVLSQITTRSIMLMQDVAQNGFASPTFQPALQNFAAIDTLVPNTSNLALLNTSNGILASVIPKLAAHPA